jgi:hypothetical protein
MFLILPRRSVSASTGDWGCRGRRTAAVGGDDGDGGPGTTVGNIVEWYGQIAEEWSYDMYCGRGHGSFPPEFRIRNSGSGIPEQINLALSCPGMI